MLKVIFLSLILSICLVNAANILAIFPVSSLPNQKLFRIVTDALEARGHELTVISTNPELGRGNSTEIDLNFTYKLVDKALFSMNIKESQDEFESMAMWNEYETEIMEKQFESAQLQELLNNREQKFHAVLVDFNGLTPWLALAEHFRAPLIGISTTEIPQELHSAHGNAANPIQNPDTRYLEVATFSERYTAWKQYLVYNFYYKPKFDANYDKIIKKFMPEVQSNSEKLKGKADLLLINTHSALGFVRPLLPSTIQLGFLHMKPPQPLEDEKLNKFIEASDKPIVYLNFGSSIKSSDLHEAYLRVFKNAFKVLPYNFIWKYEKEMTDKPDNVFITPYTQQSDLLANPKIKLFINHGGQLAMEEGIARGVPMIAMPFYGDQTLNSLRINRMGVGMAVNIHVLTEDILKLVITEIFTGPYHKNAKVISEIVNDELVTPVDKAVWNIEHTIRHEPAVYYGKNVPFYQKYMLDFIGPAVLIWHLLIKIFKLIFAKLFAKKSNDESENKKEKKNKKKRNKED